MTLSHFALTSFFAALLGCADPIAVDGGGGSADPAPASGGAGATGGGSIGDRSAETCPPEGEVGTAIGQQLPDDFSLFHCDGSPASLGETCGAEALFLFAAHGWCPLCQSVSKQAEELHDDLAAQGLASVVVVVETATGEPPDAAYCAAWRAEHGHEDVVTLHDPTGSILSLWNGSSSLSAFVDRERIIVGKLAHEADLAAIRAGIEDALE